MTGRVLVSATVDDAGRDAITEAFRSAGVDVQVGVIPARRGEGLTWLALAVLPLSGFLTGIGSALAQQAKEGVKRLVQGVLGDKHEERRPGELRLEDQDSGTTIVLTRDLPEEAYQALLALDLAAVKENTVLSWEPVRLRWMPSS